MKMFRTMFPYNCDTAIPENIAELVEAKGFDGLTGTISAARGFATIVDDVRVISSDGRTLLKYLESSRKANPAAVKQLAQERVDAAIDAGREVTEQLQYEFEEQARNEVIRYAPISQWAAFILVCPAEKLLLVSGSTAKKCEDALSFLRHMLEGLASVPWQFAGVESRVLTEYLTSGEGKSIYQLPADLTISPFGKTVATGSDTSLKITLDGVRNDTPEARSMLESMKIRTAEMALVNRPADGQIENLADFALHLPESGNPHLKRFDYDNDDPANDDGEDVQHRYAVEMLLVATTTARILKSLKAFFGVSDDSDDEQE
ncbi:recombination-associated protein RdgC [Komagataeibacter europaeus]|uniref:Recombination-associated protein RdgC n=1 Tax=Komagataeibacter europaeus TaxID=33995 RepID=A0A0M0EBY0_KOMEU|nr:recombination-associated protein RdgC [Komagataeibacter europaeus]KON62792.1 recombination-associated protein RdgC [Komagataeibacter europaeus]